MLKQRTAAADAIAAAIRPTEVSIDLAAIEAHRCVAVLLEQRRASGVALTVGLDAISSASRAAQLAVEARRAAIEAHEHLTPALRQAGLARMYGKEDAPDNKPPSSLEFFTGARLPMTEQA